MLPALRPLFILLVSLALPFSASAVNPFLSAPDDKPVSAKFKGTEWGDEIGPKDLPLTATVVTKRVAQPKWGAIYKITFENIASRAEQKREIGPLYYIATDDVIIFLNEEKPDEAIQKLAASPSAPKFEDSDIYGISKGTRHFAEGSLTTTKIEVKGDKCTYQWSHNSGHFTTVVWQKGKGLIEYAQGRGARQDGYRLKRDAGGK
jgi:hypothetical protein